jgi:Family of unknown function (DUF6281)
MRPNRPVLLLVILAAATGCAASHTGIQAGGSGACADIVTFHGVRYSGLSVRVSPVAGRVLGKAVSPPCDDTNGQLPAVRGERIGVAELPGVSPSVAIVPVGRNDSIYVRADRTHLPPAVMRLTRTPRCVSADAPISLAGPWMGILAPGGRTETDLAPPYDLSLLVQHTSSARYARAFLDVRVPVSLGRPITRPELRASLLHGGTIAITATCRSGRYVATHVETAPPA